MKDRLFYSSFSEYTYDEIENLFCMKDGTLFPTEYAFDNYEEEKLIEFKRLYDYMNDVAIWDMPYLEQYTDVLTIENIIYFEYVSAIWTEELSENFYNEWDNNDWFGCICDDYDYVISEYVGEEVAKKLWDKSAEAYLNYLNNGFLPYVNYKGE